MHNLNKNKKNNVTDCVLTFNHEAENYGGNFISNSAPQRFL